MTAKLCDTDTRAPEIQTNPPLGKTTAGFTLLEILLAIFIFSIVVVTILGSYNVVFSNADTLHQGMSDYEMAKNCLNRMVEDLTAIYITRHPEYQPPELVESLDPHHIIGEISNMGRHTFSKIRFTSGAHIRFHTAPRNGIAEITYFVEETEDDQFVLKRSDRLFLYPADAESTGDPVLCERIKSFTLTYYDGDGEEYETWDSDSDTSGYATPAAVGIKIELEETSPLKMLKTIVALPLYRAEK